MKTSEVVRNEGFKGVARAIRYATVYAVSREDSRREVREGLAEKLKRTMAEGEKPFLGALAEFVHEFNWENAHKLGSKGHEVTTEHLDQVVTLVEQHGVEHVGALLLGYGSSRAPKPAS